MRRRQIIHRTIVGGVLLSCITTSLVFAVSLTQDFKAQDDLAKGTIVSLDKQGGQVVPANIANIDNLYGVVVRDGDIAFTQDTKNGSLVPVAKDGVVDTLVSDNGGWIAVGDPITINQVSGVGQKATGPAKIIGTAQATYDGSARDSKQFSFEQNGSEKNIKVNTIPVKVGVTTYSPDAAKDATANSRNKALQLADSLAGKTVKPFTLVIAALLLLIGIFVSVFLVTSTGYASMISIGRNPLSEKKIVQSLVRMILIAVGIFSAGLLLSYAVIKLL